MADGIQRVGDVPGERADVGALRNAGVEGRAVGCRFVQQELENGDLAGLEFDVLSSAGTGVSRLPFDLQCGLGRWDLVDLAGEGRDDVFDLVA